MNPQLKQEIRDYLDSVGDDVLDYDEMKELFIQANGLLVRVEDEDEDKPKITIFNADTAGRIVMFGDPEDDDIYYVGAAYGYNDGIVYKNKKAFDEHDGICYVPEAGFFSGDAIAERCSDDMKAFIEEDHCGYVACDAGGYTRDDIYAEMWDHLDYNDWATKMQKEYGKAFVEEFVDECVAYVFQELDWQCPSTFINETDWEEDWNEYLKKHLDDQRLTDKQKQELGY